MIHAIKNSASGLCQVSLWSIWSQGLPQKNILLKKVIVLFAHTLLEAAGRLGLLSLLSTSVGASIWVRQWLQRPCSCKIAACYKHSYSVKLPRKEKLTAAPKKPSRQADSPPCSLTCFAPSLSIHVVASWTKWHYSQTVCRKSDPVTWWACHHETWGSF